MNRAAAGARGASAPIAKRTAEGDRTPAFGGTSVAFQDPDAYAAAVRNSNARIQFAAGHDFRARLTKVDLTDVLMMAAEEFTAGRVLQSTINTDRLIFLRMGGAAARGFLDGEPADPGMLRVRSQGSSLWHRGDGFQSWYVLSMRPPDFEARSAALLGMGARALLGRATWFDPEPAAWARLLDLQAAVFRTALTRPAALRAAITAAMLADQLSDALMRVIAGATPGEDRAAQRRGDVILARVERHLEAHGEKPMGLTELCTVAGCSAKTLEALFHARFGEPPNRHLRLRRLYMARQALLQAAPKGGTVSAIATPIRFLGVRPLRGRLPRSIRRVAVGDTAPQAFVEGQPGPGPRMVGEDGVAGACPGSFANSALSHRAARHEHGPVT